MIIHRAIRPRGQSWFTIECFDREFQVSYLHIDEETKEPMEFASKKSAEVYIRKYIYKDQNDPYDHGEFGEWITPNGTV
jgi:hypothetical protein